MKKGATIVLICLAFAIAFSVLSVAQVSGEDYTKVGVNQGNWSTYTVIWWQPDASIKLEVAEVSPGIIKFYENDSYANGTSTTADCYEGTTGYNMPNYLTLFTNFLSSISPSPTQYQYPIFVCSSLRNGDYIYPQDVLSSFRPKINATISENIFGIERQVNILNMTDFYIEYDRQSGILLKLLIRQANTVNVTISGTNIFSSPSGIPSTVFLAIGVTSAILVAVIVIYERRKKKPVEPSPPSKEISGINWRVNRNDLLSLAAICGLKIVALGLFVALGGVLDKLALAWDGAIYIHIAEAGYDNTGNFSFAPLYPLIIRLFDSNIIAALIIVNLFTVATAFLLYRMSNLTAALLFVSFPPFLLFGTAAYADSIMLFCLVAAYYFHLKSNYLGMWGALAFAFLAKYIALLALPLFLILVVKKHGLQIRSLWGIVMPAGAIVVIMLWVCQFTSDPLLFMHAQLVFGFSGIVDPITQANWILTGWFTNQPLVLAYSQPWQYLLRNYMFQIPLIILWVLAVWKGKWELALLGAPFVLFTLITIGMPAISTPRIILPGVWGLTIAYKGKLGRSGHVDKSLLVVAGVVAVFTAIGILWMFQHTGGQFVA